MDFQEWYRKQGMTDQQYAALSPEEQAAMGQSFSMAPSVTNSTSTGLFGLGTTDQWGTATGLGGLAMKAIALPGQMEYYGAQTDLAKQQLASNKQAMADKQKFNDTWAYASNSLPSQNSGLARQSFTGAAGYGTGTIGSTNPVLK